MKPAQRVAQVLLDTSLPQLDHLFDYAVPSSMQDEIRVGQRVRVPLRAGARQAFGYVVSISSDSAFPGELSPISDIISPVPMLTPAVYRLARELANRAAGSANDILRLAIPARQVRVEKQFLASIQGQDLQDASQGASSRTSAPLESTKRITRLCPTGVARLETGEWVPAWAEDIATHAAQYLGEGKSVIVAVPDQYDLQFALDALRATMPDAPVTRVDSSQSNADRYRNFLSALTQVPRIILGNRSAVYAPAHQLGAIILWDDADAFFEEPLAPYVHARDAALVRSSLEECDLIFASNVRSLEVERLIKMGYLAPTGSAVRKTALVTGLLTGSNSVRGDRIPDTVRQIMRDALEQGPVLVQVFASGFGTALVCAKCHTQQRCQHCQGPLQRNAQTENLATGPTAEANTVDTRARSVCRWCHVEDTRAQCPSCQARNFRDWGAGSSATAQQLERLFANTPVRMSDASNRLVLTDSRPALVVSTRGAEPLATGGYAAVILLDADAMLAIETLDAEAEAFRGWVNAAALAAPSAPIVLVGSSSPVTEAFARKLDDAWLKQTLQDRYELHFPPTVRTASLTGLAEVVDDALNALSGIETVEVLRSAQLGDGIVRAELRFGYNVGARFAAELRRVLVKSATHARNRSRSGQSRLESRLRVHVDDPAVFDSDLLHRKRRAVRR